MFDHGERGNFRKFLRREGFLISKFFKMVWKVLVTNKYPASGKYT